ncbi:hypothetical protein QG37_07706 [Candidozyma auris]|uniref:Transmembrane protein n=1 Tax=Candidozyma auris TaxID=498019 RepID=A0A0L0NPN9_CANAR|nr:hypothetical protein QG37_07706 [[Candida] auris]
MQVSAAGDEVVSFRGILRLVILFLLIFLYSFFLFFFFVLFFKMVRSFGLILENSFQWVPTGLSFIKR